jgi:uncharacterized membrane protein required for colicin V production
MRLNFLRVGGTLLALLATSAAAWAATNAPKAPVSNPTGGLEFSVVDVIVVALLGFGLWRGKKRGMSLELLDLLKWLLIVWACGLAYKPAGQLLAKTANWSLLTSYLVCYLAIFVVINSIFGTIKRIVGEKLVGADLFGRWEYYLGMLSGLTRYFCLIVVVLALLNSLVYTQQEVDEARKKQEKELGSTFFPSFGSIQREIIHKSFSGKFARDRLADHLIEPTIGSTPPPTKEPPKKKRESAVEDAISGGKK